MLTAKELTELERELASSTGPMKPIIQRLLRDYMEYSRRTDAQIQDLNDELIQLKRRR